MQRFRSVKFTGYETGRIDDVSRAPSATNLQQTLLLTTSGCKIARAQGKCCFVFSHAAYVSFQEFQGWGGGMNVSAVVLFCSVVLVICRGLGPAAAAFALSGVCEPPIWRSFCE